jgi:hypothetical protein
MAKESEKDLADAKFINAEMKKNIKAGKTAPAALEKLSVEQLQKLERISITTLIEAYEHEYTEKMTELLKNIADEFDEYEQCRMNIDPGKFGVFSSANDAMKELIQEFSEKVDDREETVEEINLAKSVVRIMIVVNQKETATDVENAMKSKVSRDDSTQANIIKILHGYRRGYSDSMVALVIAVADKYERFEQQHMSVTRNKAGSWINKTNDVAEAISEFRETLTSNQMFEGDSEASDDDHVEPVKNANEWREYWKGKLIHAMTVNPEHENFRAFFEEFQEDWNERFREKSGGDSIGPERSFFQIVEANTAFFQDFHERYKILYNMKNKTQKLTDKDMEIKASTLKWARKIGRLGFLSSFQDGFTESNVRRSIMSKFWTIFGQINDKMDAQKIQDQEDKRQKQLEVEGKKVEMRKNSKDTGKRNTSQI